MHQSFDQVIELKPHMLQLGFLKVIPGTTMSSQAEEHGLQVSTLPPYEVLATKWLTFAELNRLHIIEQLLEYYYNSGLLNYSLPYIWSRLEQSPFQWFNKFAEYWLNQGLHRVAHGREALFAHLASYMNPDCVLQDLLMVDKARMLASFPAQFKLPQESRTAWEAYLTEHLAVWQPRTYKQAFRSVYPVWLGPKTLAYLQQPPTCNVAIIDRDSQDIYGFTPL